MLVWSPYTLLWFPFTLWFPKTTVLWSPSTVTAWSGPTFSCRSSSSSSSSSESALSDSLSSESLFELPAKSSSEPLPAEDGPADWFKKHKMKHTHIYFCNNVDDSYMQPDLVVYSCILRFKWLREGDKYLKDPSSAIPLWLGKVGSNGASLTFLFTLQFNVYLIGL